MDLENKLRYPQRIGIYSGLFDKPPVCIASKASNCDKNSRRDHTHEFKSDPRTLSISQEANCHCALLRACCRDFVAWCFPTLMNGFV